LFNYVGNKLHRVSTPPILFGGDVTDIYNPKYVNP